MVITPTHSRSTASRLDGTPEQQASSAERDAQRRIAAAESTVHANENEMTHELDQMKDNYQQQYLRESAREDIALQEQQTKGYEAVRDLQRRQEAEVRRVKKEGDQQLTDVQDHYRTSVYKTETKGKEDLSTLSLQANRVQEYERQNDLMKMESIKNEDLINKAHVRDSGENKINEMKEVYKGRYEKMHETAQEADQKAQKNFQDRYNTTTAKQTSIIENLQNSTTRKIEELKEDYSAKLSAYNTRAHDPFYQMVTLKGHLYDNGDEFVFMGKVPEYEQQHISVSLRGNQLVISGRRNNEEKREISPGRTQSSASFQSFNESFPLDWPIEAKSLTKEFDGNTMTVRIAKQGEFAYKGPYQAPKPERLKVEAPRFPAGLEEIVAPKARHTDQPPEEGSGPIS